MAAAAVRILLTIQVVALAITLICLTFLGNVAVKQTAIASPIAIR
jgi:hypothetical protein